jgi:hypothetical protein
LKETPRRGSTRNQHVWIWPNNGFTSGSLFCRDAGGLGGEKFSAGSNGLALHRRRAERRRSARSRRGPTVRPRGDRPLCGRTEPRVPTRGVGASPVRGLCPPDPIRPGGRAGPRRWTGRFCQALRGQGQPLPHPPRRDEDRGSRLMSPAGGGPPEGVLPAALPSTYRLALPPPLLREGGARLCQSCDLYIQNPSRTRVCRWAQRRGIRPHVAGLRAPGEGACRRQIRGGLAAVIGPSWKAFPSPNRRKSWHRLGRASP